MAVVYEKKSGKPFKCEPVDASELVKSKFYVAKDPKAKGAEDPVKPEEDPVKPE